MLKPWNKISSFLLLLWIIIPASCFGAEYWQQFVHYKISAKLNPDGQLIDGRETILYQNNSPDTLFELFFHLYPNAFQKNSIMAKEAKAADIEIIRSPEDMGWLKIDSLVISNPRSLRKISIDIIIENTILKIKISPYLLPGEQLLIVLNFVTKIRKYNPAGGKGGYERNLYEVSQWYPKICVYDENGWNPIQYHWLGEFYGEFGIFDVTLNVPDSFIVAATGEVVAGDPGWQVVEVDSSGNWTHDSAVAFHGSNAGNGSSRRIVTFHAENVHDFVWTASPDYLYQSTVWRDVPIHILFKKSSKNKWQNIALKNAATGLKWLHDLIGEYPYPQLVVCEGVLSGGMEYPMVTILGHTDLTLIVHEICHQYFYGALANNEQYEAWLDEGIVTYISEFLVEQNVPQENMTAVPSIPIQTAFIKEQFGPYELNDIKLNSLYYYFYSGFARPIATKCFEIKNRYLYSYNVYLLPSRFFKMLDYLVGRETFKQIIHTYYVQYKFRHVKGVDFQKICEQVYGKDLDWFFDQWLGKTIRIDYACTDVSSMKQNNGQWKTDIVIKRLGNGVMPVEIQFLTRSGDTIRKRWKGDAPETTISLLTNSKIKDFQLDPDDIILDQNRLNNSKFRMKTYFYPDFPGMYYLPRNAYSLFWWPQIWYNDVDGLKIGLKFLGGYLNRYYVIRNNLWFGLKSRQVDYNFGYSMPWEKLNKNLWRHLYLAKIEGRIELNLCLNYILSKQFAGAKAQHFVFGFLHQDASDNQYTFRKIDTGSRTIKIQTWDKGNVNKFYWSYNTNCFGWLPQYNFEFNGQISDKAWGSDFDFAKFSLINQFELGSVKSNWKVNVRNFIGYAYRYDDQMPIQDRYWVAEGNPSQQFKYYYLRSIGSLPAWLNYHFPGDGNLRGYLNKLILGNSPLTTNQLISANIDFVHRKFHHLLPNKIRVLVQGIDFTLFFDAGRVWDDDFHQNYLFDAGFGLRFYKIILGQQKILRIDFPLWLSHPQLDKLSHAEPHWKFRWMVSFQ